MGWCVIVAIYRAQGAFCCTAVARLLVLQSDVLGDRESQAVGPIPPLGPAAFFLPCAPVPLRVVRKGRSWLPVSSRSARWFATFPIFPSPGSSSRTLPRCLATRRHIEPSSLSSA